MTDDELTEGPELDETPTPPPVPAAEAVPTMTDVPCTNCGAFMLSDGFCPRCYPRVIAPGP